MYTVSASAARALPGDPASAPSRFRTVLVGHDGTPAADAALRLAEQLADEDGMLVLARVVRARDGDVALPSKR
ncbi:MAG TPA: hypothetical protein VEX67_03945 [Solirubrobacteraceae bacterium]|nr:hypothetical protein [Solirubrobacteraceae bacterium]